MFETLIKSDTEKSFPFSFPDVEPAPPVSFPERFSIQLNLVRKLEPKKINPIQTPSDVKGKAKPPEVADILRLYGEDFLKTHLVSAQQEKVMRHILTCRTAVQGGHVEVCDHCGQIRISYNSCRNRHCPKCRTMKKEKWLNDRKAELLPCSYFHNVFTLPHELNPVALCNKKVVFNLLFKSVSEVLKDFAADPQWRLNGKIGILAILHTWSQILLDHFHLHCLIPAGALSFDAEKWTPAGKKFLFKTSSLGKAFKTRFIVKFREAYEKGQLNFPGDAEIFGTPEGFNRLIKNISGKQWVVFSKAPFAGPEQVLEYLGRYTHRVAISNHRIKSIDDGKIVFSYKDRDDQDKVKHMTLDADEFIRRFLLHVLPDGFMKIRYFGFLANRYKAKNIKTIRHLIGHEEPMYEKQTESAQEVLLRITGEDITVCPFCKKGKMRIIDDLTRYNAFTFKKQKRILKLTPDTS